MIPIANPNPLLEMRALSSGALRDPHRVVFEDVHWSVNSGDFWVIGGLQGSGKTDFALLVAGLMAPLAGSYHFLGESMPIFEDTRLIHRLKLGLVFDGGQLLNHLTVSENVALPIRYHQNLTMAEAKAEVEELLQLTDLSELSSNTPGALGRNWQQRVGLARALTLRPEVLVLDNPLTGLDLRHRSWWLRFLGELSRGHSWYSGRPVTLVVTTDDLRPWGRRAKQFAMIKGKRLLVIGSWEQLQQSGDDQVLEFMSAVQQAV